MSDETKKAAIEEAMLEGYELKGTDEVLKRAAEVREARREENERLNQEYKFPSTYDPSMGMKQGSITELGMVFHVKPGHAEALKAELRKFKEKEARQSKIVHLMTGIRTMTCRLFDNDTRYFHTTEFDNDWNPYIEDALPTEHNRVMYALWLQHLEEAGDISPDNPPTANDVKVLFRQQQVEATAYLRSFDQSNLETYKMMDLKKAFDEVLNHPDAEAALSHPALAPLLELAAD